MALDAPQEGTAGVMAATAPILARPDRVEPRPAAHVAFLMGNLHTGGVQCMTMLLAVWLATGFVAWTFDGLVLTFGEVGLLPPTLAAWTPPLVFAAVAGWLMLHDERRKVRRAPRVPVLG